MPSEQELPTASDEGEERLDTLLWSDGNKSPTRTVRCRHCRTLNRVGVRRAAVQPERIRCGSCDQALFLGAGEALLDLSPEAYQHALDRRSVAALQSIPGLSRHMRKLLRAVGDRTAHTIFMSESVRCSEEQFPELIQVVNRACARLDLRRRPVVYLGESPFMNAMTTGVGKPVLVVHSALLDQMNDTEVLAVVGHELGHLQSDHPLYGSVARVLVQGWLGTSSTARTLSWPIQGLLLRWLRYAELTADRAALLASGSLRASIGMMATFAGGNRPGTAKRTRLTLAPFVEQCRRLARLESRSTFQWLLGGYLTMARTHPPLATRVVELLQWVEHGSYLDILAGNYLRRTPTENAPSVRQPARLSP